jgi:antitoxin ParD1/3/4
MTMLISLTPELVKIVKEKVASGLYNNASEVVREALRFMKTNEEMGSFFQSIKSGAINKIQQESRQDAEN